MNELEWYKSEYEAFKQEITMLKAELEFNRRLVQTGVELSGELEDERDRLRKALEQVENHDPYPDLSSHKYYDAFRLIRPIVKRSLGKE
jgi:hypothetical protein